MAWGGGISFTFTGGVTHKPSLPTEGLHSKSPAKRPNPGLRLDVPSSQQVHLPDGSDNNKHRTSNNPVGLNRMWVTAPKEDVPARDRRQQEGLVGNPSLQARWALPLTGVAAGVADGWSKIENGVTCFQGPESSGG